MLPEQLVRQPYLNCLTREQGLELEFGISEDTIRLLEQKGHRPVRVPVDQAMSTMLNSVMYVDGEYHAAGTQRVDGCGGAPSLTGIWCWTGSVRRIERPA